MHAEGPMKNASPALPTWARLARDGCFGVLLVLIIWAPFPLGSNREWSWSILTILTACCWLLWSIWACVSSRSQFENLRKLTLPLIAVVLCLVWAVIQVLPIVPKDWSHPLWPVTGNLLSLRLAGKISLNVWRTEQEIIKLATYIATAWIAFTLARNPSRAKLITDIVVAAGASYAFYGFTMALLGISQFDLFYAIPQGARYLSGPFVLHNSFATYEGMIALAALARLAELMSGAVVVSKGMRIWALTSFRFLSGSGTWFIIALILALSALMASASRGGSLATLCGLLAMATTFASRPRSSRGPSLIGIGSLGAALIALVWISGDQLITRFGDLVDAGGRDETRATLWSAAARMIESAPFLGLGVGTFQDAYPMYALKMIPFLIDKAHCDYLEFAAGIGLPAAILWWASMLWALLRMVSGAYTRRRNLIYPLIGVGVTVLVAVHSAVDFSLQIPAVALTYAVLLGTGLGQSYSSEAPTRD